MEPNVADLRYFKLWILLDQIIWVQNIKGLQHLVLWFRFKYLILFQRLNFFNPNLNIRFYHSSFLFVFTTKCSCNVKFFVLFYCCPFFFCSCYIFNRCLTLFCSVLFLFSFSIVWLYLNCPPRPPPPLYSSYEFWYRVSQ